MRILLSILFSLYFTSALAYYWPNRYYGVYDFEVDGIYYVINSPDSTEVWVWHGATSEEERFQMFKTPQTYYTGDVVIPNYVEFNNKKFKVTTIGQDAFYNSHELNSIKLPNSIISIEAYAIHDCKNLINLNLPPNLEYIGESALNGCTSLELDWDNLPTSLRYISTNTFGGVKTPERIVFPDSMVTFYEKCMPNADIIEFGKNIPIGDHYFTPHLLYYSILRCTNKKTGEVVLPKSKFYMSIGAVRGSTIKRIVLPEADSILVEKPGIRSCKNLTEFISYNPTPPVLVEHPRQSQYNTPYEAPTMIPTDNKVTNGWLDDYSGVTYSSVTLIVPTGSEEAYRNAPVWCNFENIKGVDDIDAYRTAGLDDLFKDEWDAPEIITTETGITINVWQPERVTIYSVNGMQIYNDVVNESASVNLANGFYIVRAGTHSIKVKI